MRSTRIQNRVQVPGDKSISHRAFMLAPLATGTSRVSGVSPGADVAATRRALRALGAEIREIDPLDGSYEIDGPADLHGLESILDCGNSGTTARLLLGLLSGAPLTATLDGDGSLRRRPMARVLDPLRGAGARFRELGEPGRLPVEVTGGSLRPIEHASPVASAQVKSAMLLAGLIARVAVRVREPGPSRDHTERMLRAMGVRVTTEAEGNAREIGLEPPTGALRPLALRVPGDLSSAAFFLALGALGGAGEGVQVDGVGLNPGRTGLLKALRAMGADLEIEPSGEQGGEPVGAVTVRASELRGIEVPAEWIPELLDEIPVLACAAVRARGRTVVRGAAELRVKESDRLRTLARNLAGLGARVEERDDGLVIEGGAGELTGRVETEGDHRIAMAFGVLGVSPGARIEIDDPDCVAVSYPGFWEDLARVSGRRPG